MAPKDVVKCNNMEDTETQEHLEDAGLQHNNNKKLILEVICICNLTNGRDRFCTFMSICRSSRRSHHLIMLISNGFGKHRETTSSQNLV